MTAIKRTDQTQGDSFVPRRRIGYRRIGAPVAGRVVAHEYVGQDRVAEIAGADSEGQICRHRFYLLRAAKRMDAILVIKNDALKNLKGHPKRSPWIILKKRNQSGPVESQRIP